MEVGALLSNVANTICQTLRVTTCSANEQPRVSSARHNSLLCLQREPQNTACLNRSPSRGSLWLINGTLMRFGLFA